MTRRNFRRLPPASWLHTFQTFFLPIILILPVLRAAGHGHTMTSFWYCTMCHLTGWVRAARGTSKYSGISSCTRMANNELTLHRAIWEPHNTYPTKPKWNAFSTETLLCRIPKMPTVTPMPSATRGSVMKGKSECKETVFKLPYCSKFYINMSPSEHIFGTPPRAL